LLKKLEKNEVAAFVKGKLPTGKSIRSGELGEVLRSAYVPARVTVRLTTGDNSSKGKISFLRNIEVKPPHI